MGPEISVYLAGYNAVQVEIPKVACTSLKVTFARLLGLSLHESGGNPHVVDFPHPDTTAAQSADHLYPGLFAFAFVRVRYLNGAAFFSVLAAHPRCSRR